VPVWDAMGSLIGQVGLAGFCFLFLFVAVGLGWLVPRWSHIQRINDLKEANRDLRAALAKKDEAMAEKDQQIAIILGRYVQELTP
jgi:hypothetical protein